MPLPKAQVLMQTLTTDKSKTLKGLKSAFVLSDNGVDSPTKTVIYKEEKRKRRVSKRWRKLEKTVRRLTKAQGAASREYLERHERSNERKKNGWIKKLGTNVQKSVKRGLKKLE
jgi:hypothetical protein